MTSEVKSTKFLKEKERDLILFIEKFHSLAGVTPADDSMMDYLKSLGYNINSQELEIIKENPLFKKSLDARGIVIGKSYAEAGRLSVKQMTAAAIMTNYTDRRSDEKKLRDLGISSSEWQTWLLDEKFYTYLQGRTERILGNSVHEAHLGLIRGVRQGNVQAIKLLYEITDRYNPDKDEQVNVRVLLGRVVEVIQKHVKDPEVLTNLARELTQVAIEASPIGDRVIQGTAVARK